MNDLPKDSAVLILSNAKYIEPTLQTDDILNISVQTIDPNATIGVNQNVIVPSIGSSSASATGTQQIAGFRVDEMGNIALNYVGQLHVGGLTLLEAKQAIQTAIATYFNNAVVNVTLVNFKITVLGEVQKPGTYVFPYQKVSIWDALGMSGDLSIYGKRETLLLIRNKDDQSKEYVRINLNTADFINSPYFYLRQGDVLYVEPTSGKVAANNTDRMQTVTIASSIVSTLALIMTVVLNATSK